MTHIVTFTCVYLAFTGLEEFKFSVSINNYLSVVFVPARQKVFTFVDWIIFFNKSRLQSNIRQFCICPRNQIEISNDKILVGRCCVFKYQLWWLVRYSFFIHIYDFTHSMPVVFKLSAKNCCSFDLQRFIQVAKYLNIPETRL